MMRTVTMSQGAVFFNPGYPVGANFKEYEKFDGKINGYENIRMKIKGCETLIRNASSIQIPPTTQFLIGTDRSQIRQSYRRTETFYWSNYFCFDRQIEDINKKSIFIAPFIPYYYIFHRMSSGFLRSRTDDYLFKYDWNKSIYKMSKKTFI